MKKQSLILFFGVLIGVIYSQDIQKFKFVCEEGSAVHRSVDEKGGLFLPSRGTINTLVVFVQFKDDLDSTTGWPTYVKEQRMELPPWAFEFAGKGKGITDYFDVMSKGRLNLAATIYPDVIIPESESSGYSSLHEVNYEVIEKLDTDPKFSFSAFDNWSGPLPGADGVVDLIFIIYRDFPNSLVYGGKWTGNSSLWLPSNGYYSLNDDKKILGSSEKGSGIQLRAASNGLEYTMFQAAHEFGHKLFGSGHIKYGLANLSLMGDNPVWSSSRGMCAWEKEKLGWLDYIIKEGDEIFEIHDYMTNDEAIKIKLPGIEQEFFILENRQKQISYYDLAGDEGIYIYHVKGADQSLPEYIDVECADGNYKWEFDETTLTVKRGEPDPYNGQDEMNFYVKFDSNDDDEKETYGCFKDGGYYKDAAWGDQNDAFDDVYNNVFSPVSNPPSTNGANFPFSIEILENIDNSGVYKVRLYYSDAYEGRPAKPFGLTGYTYTFGEFGSTSARGTMKWSHYDYQDHDEYEVYRAISTDGLEPDKSQYSFVTNAIGISMSPRISLEDYGDNNRIYYRIKAKDSKGNRSIFSDSFYDWAPPATPVISITRSIDGHPIISWYPPESNELEVYLRKRADDIWNDPVRMMGNYFEDNTIDWPIGHVANETDFYYYVFTQRRNDLQSPHSDIVNPWSEGGDWLLKDGSEDSSIPKEFGLAQNYPNPFNPSSTIKYQLPKDVHVSIKVYDILGNGIAELVNGNLTAGYYEALFDGGELPSGVYIYQLIAGEFKQSKKMLLVK